MNEISVAGRLLSENKGIDSLVKHVVSNKNIRIIILCGKEVKGHRTGHSLLALHRHGIDIDHKIIDSTSPDPVLTITHDQVITFQNQVQIINKINETNFLEIQKLILSMKT